MSLIVTLFVLSLDQLSKFIVTKNFTLNQSVPVVKGVFHLTLVHNRGAAFGIFKDQTVIFIATSIIAVAMIFSKLRASGLKGFSVNILSLALILSGALGNLIDRLAFGYVIDFLDFRVWPVFNVADSAITAGAILLGWSILFNKNTL